MKTKHFLTLGLLTLSSTLVFASGNGAGNGGGALYCDTGAGTNVTFFLDLVEAQTASALHPAWTILRTNQPHSLQRANAITKFAQKTGRTDLADKIRAEVALFGSSPLFDGSPSGNLLAIPAGEQLTFPADSQVRRMKVPANCSPRGVGNYDDVTNQLEYDPVLTKSMGETDLAAFEFHEAYYRVLRKSKIPPSVSTSARLMTGSVFSVENIPVKLPSSFSAAALFECKGKSNELVIVKELDGSRTLEFSKINGEDLIDETWAKTSDASLTQRILDTGLVSHRWKATSDEKKASKIGDGIQTSEEVFSIHSLFSPEFQVKLYATDLVDGCPIDQKDCDTTGPFRHTFSQNNIVVLQSPYGDSDMMTCRSR
jgi:hypothetical protein